MLAPLAQFGPYRVITFLGCGQLGETYVAQDIEKQQDLILKVMYPRWSRPPRMANAFESRFATLKKQRPGVMPVLSYGTLDNRHYITQPYHTDGHLGHRIAYNVAFDQALSWIMQILETLTTLHAAGLIHYNLKPQNILFDRSAAPVVCDFGVDPALYSEAAYHDCAPDPYRAPEFGPAATVDQRCDLYSIGAIWFNLLAGPLAHKHLPLDSPLSKIIAAESQAVQRRLNPFQTLLDRLLSPTPDHRYNTSTEVMYALTDALTPRPNAQPQDDKSKGDKPSMKTIATKTVRCASCATCFRVPPDLFQKARVKLKCSQCGNLMVLPRRTPARPVDKPAQTSNESTKQTMIFDGDTSHARPMAPGMPPLSQPTPAPPVQELLAAAHPVPKASSATLSQTGMAPTPISVHWRQIMQTAIPAGAVVPCHTCIELSRSDLRETAEIQIFEGTRRVLTVAVPYAAPQASSNPYRLTIAHENQHLNIALNGPSHDESQPQRVKLSTWDQIPWHLFYPSRISPSELFMVQVYAQTDEGDRPLPTSSAQLPAPLTAITARGTRVDFELVLPGFDVLSRRLGTRWEGRSTSVHFTVKPQPHLTNGQYRGHLLMTYDSVPYGIYALSIAISEHGQTNAPTELPTGNAVRLQRFFVIYDQIDQPQALKRLQQLNLMGLPYFKWVAGASPNAKPTKEQYRRLEGCDAVILLWSPQTELSRPLQKFCQYAAKHLSHERLLAVFIGDNSDVRLPASLADWPVYRNILTSSG